MIAARKIIIGVAMQQMQGTMSMETGPRPWGAVVLLALAIDIKFSLRTAGHLDSTR